MAACKLWLAHQDLEAAGLIDGIPVYVPFAPDPPAAIFSSVFHFIDVMHNYAVRLVGELKVRVQELDCEP